MPKSLKIWIDASRPKTLPAAIAPVVIGLAMAAGEVSLHIPTLIATLFSALGIQIGTNFANDYYDFKKGTDTAERVGPTRATQAGLVTPAQMKLAFFLAFGFATLLGLYLVYRGGWPILVIGIASLLSGWLYTAGPLPLGYVGLADLFVLVFFGPVAVGGTYYLQTGTVNQNVLIAGLAPGFIATAILVVNNVRDIKTDQAGGKKTLPVRFGRGFGVFEYWFCLLLAFAVPVYLVLSLQNHVASLFALVAVAPAIGATRKVATCDDPGVLNNTLADTGKILFVYSFLFSIGWLL